MAALSPEIAIKFHDLCNWAHATWRMHRAFSDDPRTADAAKAGHAYFLTHLSVVSQEYTLLQMAKLHDPASQQGRISLTIEYVLEYGGWDAETKDALQALSANLRDLYTRIRPARNRVIAHNDLSAILDGASLGSFPTGLDDSYSCRSQLASR